MKIVIVTLFTIALGCAPAAIDIDKELREATTDTIKQGNQPGAQGGYLIHADGKPCPDGWLPLPDHFTERDGSHQDGCFIARSPNGEVKSDYLLAGESMSYGIHNQ